MVKDKPMNVPLEINKLHHQVQAQKNTNKKDNITVQNRETGHV